MGRLATLNPRSAQGKADPEAEARAHLEQMMRALPTRLAYERWLRDMPAAPGLSLDQTHAEIRRQTQPYCLFTVEARRARRLEREAHARLVKERALRLLQHAAEERCSS